MTCTKSLGPFSAAIAILDTLIHEQEARRDQHLKERAVIPALSCEHRLDALKLSRSMVERKIPKPTKKKRRA